MKKIAIIAGLLMTSYGYSQLTIGKNTASSPSSSIEFADGNRGMILPWVDDASGMTAANGTMVFDLTTNKVMVKYQSGWTELSQTEGQANSALQDGKFDKATAKVSIGEPGLDSPDGILVLEDNNRAMILPKVVEPDKNLASPEPGTMVYDPNKQLLAVFNGDTWSYWWAASE